jgi:hypothetical protein
MNPGSSICSLHVSLYMVYMCIYDIFIHASILVLVFSIFQFLCRWIYVCQITNYINLILQVGDHPEYTSSTQIGTTLISTAVIH